MTVKKSKKEIAIAVTSSNSKDRAIISQLRALGFVRLGPSQVVAERRCRFCGKLEHEISGFCYGSDLWHEDDFIEIVEVEK